jgi:hypothetical protein
VIRELGLIALCVAQSLKFERTYSFIFLTDHK